MSSTQTTFDKGSVNLEGSYETLLITLYARAQDAESPRPILNDEMAVKVVSRIQDQGYDFLRATAGKENSTSWVRSVATRARIMDICTEQFLERNAGPATILHLACGMDTRSQRIRWQGEGRLWVDVDTKEAVQLRQQVMDKPDTGKGGEYRLLDPNITEPAWLEACNIPHDRPLLVLFEGLTPYLTGEEIYTLLRVIVKYSHDHDIQGEIRFDAPGPIMYFLINYVFNKELSKMGTQFQWYLSNPKSLEKQVPGLKYRGSMFRMQDYARFGSPSGWLMMFFLWVLDLLNMGQGFGRDYGYSF